MSSAVTVLLSHAAKRWGCEVTTARTLADGRKAAQRDLHYDVLVIDVGLPDGSGIELLAELRQTPRYRDRPALVLTGGASAELVRQAGLLNAQVITKPFSPTKLGTLISEMTTKTRNSV